MITELLTKYNEYMNNTFANNEMLIGLITTMFLSVLLYMIKSYPLKLFYFILKHTTRTLEVSSDSHVYTDLMDVLKAEGIFLTARNLRLKNGIWGWSKVHEQTLGLGSGWYFLKNSLVEIHVYQEDNSSQRVIHTMRIRVFGKSLEVINHIIDDSNAKLKDETKTNVYRVIDDKIELFSSQPRYTISDVILTKEAEEAVNRVLKFSKSEEFYKKNSIAWKYGMMLHGIPGAGKTKLLKCVAGELGWDILEITSVSDFSNLPKLDTNTLVCVEEIDKLVGANKTLDDKGEPVTNDACVDNNKSGTMEVMSNIMKGEFLTSVDGVCELWGILIVATTNHLEYLHPAMYRDGRMDEVVEFKSMGMYEFKQFFNKYYPNDTFPEDYQVGEFTGSSLEKSKKQRLTVDEFLNKFKK